MVAYVSLSEKLARVRVHTTVADFRSQIGRVFFFAILVAHGRSEEERAYYRTLMGIAKSAVNGAFDALLTNGPKQGLEDSALAWARAKADAVPDLADNMRAFHKAVEEAIDRIDSDPGGVITFLLDITDKADALFGGSFARLLKSLEGDILEADSSRLDAATQATEGAKAAVGRIDAISRSVRLISLNAAVEAARVGDTGRGFSVIAGEIKTLAEAIASASQEAGRSMDELREVAKG